MSFVDLSEPLRDAIISNSGITSLLESYKGSYPVFTRRPVPDDAPDIAIIISQDVSGVDNDGINFFRPVITRDIMVYGTNELASNFRKVQQIARKIHDLFHHKPTIIDVYDHKVVNITAVGPLSVPQDDQSVMQAVTVEVTLAKHA